MADYKKELQVAREAADAAGDVINHFRNNTFTIDFKGKNDLVTEADVKAEEKILSVLDRYFPDDVILAEESSNQKAMTEERTWLIDPIDGTTNFTHGFPIFCVSIGFWENRLPKMGLVLEVCSQEYYSATAGEGAFLNGEPITVSTLSNPQNALVGTGFPYSDLSLVNHYLEMFHSLMYKTQGVRRPGSAAYDLCCVACGRFDGFFEYSLSPWDVGAAALIVKEAGGKITDWNGGEQWLSGERIAAGNPPVHQFLLEEISEQFTDEEIQAKISR